MSSISIHLLFLRVLFKSGGYLQTETIQNCNSYFDNGVFDRTRYCNMRKNSGNCYNGVYKLSNSKRGRYGRSASESSTNPFVIKTNTVHLIHRIADEQTDRHTAMELYNNVKATIAKLFSECGWYFLSFFPICTMKFEEDYLLI